MKTIDTIRTENLIRLVKDKGGLVAFSEKIEREQSQVSQWINNSINSGTGKPRVISSKSCRRIEEIFSLTAGWFDVDHSSNVENPVVQDKVPVISWVAAGTWAPMSDQTTEPIEWIPCPFKYGKGTFSLIVRGISMYNPTGERSFKDGDLIFIDPTIDPINKDYVIARLESESEATFKQLIIEDNQKMLMAINPDWKPRLIPVNGNASIVGVVIGKIERWR